MNENQFCGALELECNSNNIVNIDNILEPNYLYP
jgi:hypothetical protein